jgi:hypothetical protein
MSGGFLGSIAALDSCAEIGDGHLGLGRAVIDIRQAVVKPRQGLAILVGHDRTEYRWDLDSGES